MFTKLDPARETLYTKLCFLMLPQYQNVQARLELRRDLLKLSNASVAGMTRGINKELAKNV